MSEENDNFLGNTALPAMLVGYSMFFIGYTIYSLIILPSKFVMWTLKNNRSPAGNVFISSPITISCYGISSLLAIFYGIEIFTGRYGFNTTCHIIMTILVIMPSARALSGTFEEFCILHAPLKLEDHNYSINTEMIFHLFIRVAFGLTCAAFIVYSIVK